MDQQKNIYLYFVTLHLVSQDKLSTLNFLWTYPIYLWNNYHAAASEFKIQKESLILTLHVPEVFPDSSDLLVPILIDFNVTLDVVGECSTEQTTCSRAGFWPAPTVLSRLLTLMESMPFVMSKSCLILEDVSNEHCTTGRQQIATVQCAVRFFLTVLVKVAFLAPQRKKSKKIGEGDEWEFQAQHFY